MFPIIPAVLLVAAVVGLASCGGKAETTPVKSPEKKTAKKKESEEPKEPKEPKEPEPPEVDEEDEAQKAKCQGLSGPFGSSDFFVKKLSTVTEGHGYRAALGVGKDSSLKYIYLGPAEKSTPDNYFPFKEGHKITQMDIAAHHKDLSAGCALWELDKTSHENVVNKVDEFVDKYAKEFLSLRDKAKLIRVADVPWNDPTLGWVVMALDRPLIVDQISKTKIYEQHSKRKLIRSLNAFKRYFSDVGLEYVTDPTSKLRYVAVYSHVDDKKNGKQPLLFMVDKPRARGDKSEPLLFVHNFNEDTGAHYLDPEKKKQSKPGSKAAVPTNKEAYDKCAEKLFNGDQVKACQKFVDVCMAASDASAKVILYTDFEAVTAANRDACLSSAIELAFWGYESVE